MGFVIYPLEIPFLGYFVEKKCMVNRLSNLKVLESESNVCPKGSKVTWSNYDILRQTR